MSIQILEANIVDQIAAGEVVERPSHLVKELVENSLDAGARRIEIEVQDGGRAVRVKDDGVGMSPEDLQLACARHATSKIISADDLWSLHTFGFRGEALASIGAVSFLKITSRQKSQAYAHTIECRFGKLSTPAKSGTELGTSVEVADLFENVPARLKFLKSETAEATQIKNTIKSIAISHPEVEFVLHLNGKLSFVYPQVETLLERVRDVTESSDLFFTSNTVDQHSVEIVFGSPNATAKTSRQMWTFVQNRWVVDRGMQAAVTEAYRTLLMHGEYPIAVIKVQMPTEDVDVNIHPTKSQVKFVDQSRIFRLVHHTLRGALERAPWIEAMKKTSFAPSMASIDNGQFESVPSEENNFELVSDVTPSSLSFGGDEFFRTQYSTRSFSPPTMDRDTSNQKLTESIEKNSVTIEGSAFWSALRVIGQSHLTYILAESSDSLFLIDQHAAHERVMFERLMDGKSKKNLDIQNFLIPLAVDVSGEYREAILNQSSELETMGLMVESGGPETILIAAAPSIVKDRAVAEVLVKFAEDMVSKGGSFSIEKKVADIFATMACHSAIRAGNVMSIDEMSSLLAQMDQFKLSSYCPHGRNVYIQMPKTKIERDFGRIV
jgi:DNA mismatch repair protein MutL